MANLKSLLFILLISTGVKAQNGREIELRVLKLVNRVRSNDGLSPVSLDTMGHRRNLDHAQTMFNTQMLIHQPEIYHECISVSTTNAELQGYDEVATNIVNRFLNSERHKNIILWQNAKTVIVAVLPIRRKNFGTTYFWECYTVLDFN
jgi:uncharacterized protein YkwD